MLENCFKATVSTSPSEHTRVGSVSSKINSVKQTRLEPVVYLFEEEMVSGLSDSLCSRYYVQANKKLNSAFKGKLPT